MIVRQALLYKLIKSRRKWRHDIQHNDTQHNDILPNMCDTCVSPPFYHYAECRQAKYPKAGNRYAECRYAECRYAECRNAKRHGTNETLATHFEP